MSESRTSKAQNLARIRDNQRRSRARRKEYLQELEAKLRNFEHVGIEASAEIQSAARRVLEENRKLRTLLHDRGVSESEIVTALGGTVSERSYDQLSAASSLNNVLERRITPSFTESSPITIPNVPRLHPNLATVPPLTIPVPRSNALSSIDSLSPHSITSSMDEQHTFSNTNTAAAYYHCPMTPGPEIKTEDIVPAFVPYEPSAFNANSWTYPSDAQFISDPTASYYNTTSCIDAANIIRTMRAGVDPTGDFGCRGPLQDCYVNNAVVFGVMDRYSTPSSV